MFPAVDTRDSSAVQSEVIRLFHGMFPGEDATFIKESFELVARCFRGQHSDYQPIDARYHDLEHTLQGTLCMTRMLAGREKAGAEPRLTVHMFELGLLAILFHDTGYLKTRDDKEGTGAKYTLTHVDRSADFAAHRLAEQGFSDSDIKAVRNMIQCTGVNANVRIIPFQSELEKVVSYSLGSADLLGQMAANDYVEKLPVLYEEFAEAVAFTHDYSQFIASFTTAQDLVKKTPVFWRMIVLPKLENQFDGVYRFLNDPSTGRNEYIQHVEANLGKLTTEPDPRSQVPA